MWPGHGIVQLNNTALYSETYVGHVRCRQNDEALEEMVELEIPARCEAPVEDAAHAWQCLAMSAAGSQAIH
jgi:hypothetical protein